MFISKVMTRNVVTIDKDADISQAQEKMSKHLFRHLPVVDENNHLIGIVTDRDIRSVLPSSHLVQENSPFKSYSYTSLSSGMVPAISRPFFLNIFKTVSDGASLTWLMMR